MKKLFYVFTLLGIVSIGFLFSGSTIEKDVSKKELITSKGIVVLELFTSQGCSSCPPADALLGKYILENNPNVLPLSFHVDYWNYIGWNDPFSQAKFSERQRVYAENLHSSVYTPQLFINGKWQVTGSNKKEIDKLISKELDLVTDYKFTITSHIENDNQIKVIFNSPTIKKNLVLNLALAKKKTITTIKRGENKGVELNNYNVVLSLNTFEINNKNTLESTLKFKKEWNSSDYILVAYVQNNKTGIILSAQKNDLNQSL
jgi:hypothetical protein